MKYLIILIMTATIFASCKKEEISLNKKQNSYLIEKFQAQPTRTALAGCAYDLNGKNVFGVQCYRNDYMNQCPRIIPCVPITVGGDYIELKKLLDLGFTEESLSKWIFAKTL